MYYPYLRGRQNELLCIRELLEENKLSIHIVPVIEPIHLNSTLILTFNKFIKFNREIIIILNPKVGSFKKEYNEIKNTIANAQDEKERKKAQLILDSFKNILKSEYVIKAYLNDQDIITKILSKKINVKNTVLINNNLENYIKYEDYEEQLIANITFIPDNQNFLNKVNHNAVVLSDGFHKVKPNIDYNDYPDELFSQNHINYNKNNRYIGFSDYSIAGQSFEVGGFRPKALVIHILYFSEDELRIHHFLSDSNDDYNDLGRKFEEAMKKIINWELYNIIPKTYGFNKLLDCYYDGKFPNLGVIKRYCFMHHIQMIGDYLDNNKYV